MKTGLIDRLKNALAPHSNGEFDPISAERLNTNLIDQTVSQWLGKSKSGEPMLDRVLTTAIDEQLISLEDVDQWLETIQSTPQLGASPTLNWRTVVKIDPWRTQQFERMAARVYGFRSVLICQMSTLVLADTLSVRVQAKQWDDLYELGCAPVVEHGHSPQVNGRVICISKDPSSRITRDYVNQISCFQPELAYADGAVVKGMLEMIAQHVPAIGATVYVSRPTMQKVPTIRTTNKRAA